MRPDSTKPARRRLRRPEIDIGRARFALPSGFTLGNLFFGVYAIISASRGEIDRAVLCIVLGGVCDAFDGRVARATKSGSEFGEELDSLVDAISFGLAPAMITYFNVMNTQQGWGWVLVWIYCACAVLRLARFNITQAGAAKSYFVGLPSPAAGGTLATYHWFKETELFRQSTIGTLPWDEWVRWLMLALAFLMISNVRYPAVPRIGYRSLKQILGTLVVLVTLVGAIFFAHEYLFPFGLAYVLYGLAATVFVGLLDMRPNSAAARERALREAYDRPEYALATEELMADDVAEEVEFTPRRAPRESGAHSRAAGSGPAPERDSRDREARKRARREREKGERGDRPERPARDRADRPERAERAPKAEPKAERAPKLERADAAGERDGAPTDDAEEKAARDRRAERRERQRERQRERKATRDAEATQVSVVPGAEAVALAPVHPAVVPPPVALDIDADDLADAGDADGADEAEGGEGPEAGDGTPGEQAERKRRKRRRKRRARGLPEGAPPDPAATFSPDDPVIPARETTGVEPSRMAPDALSWAQAPAESPPDVERQRRPEEAVRPRTDLPPQEPNE